MAAVEALHHTETELDERTAWALRLQEEAQALAEQLDAGARLRAG